MTRTTSPARPAPRRTTERAPLDIDRILDGATALIEADGADAFSMRRLATSLHVTPMALYKWFDDRDALLTALSDRAFADFDLPADVDGRWTDRMLLVAHALRSEMLASRAILPLVGGRRRTDLLMVRCADRVLSLLMEVGYGIDDAIERFRSFHWSIVGFVFTIDAGTTLPANDEGTPRLRELADAVAALGPDRVPVLAAAIERFTPVDLDDLFTATMRTLVLGIAADAPDGDAALV